MTSQHPDFEQIQQVAAAAGQPVETVTRFWGRVLGWDGRKAPTATLVRNLNEILECEARWARQRIENDGSEQADYVPLGALGALAAAAREGR